MTKILFEETQRSILLLVPIPIAVFFGAMAGIQVISGKPIGTKPAPDIAMVLIFLFMAALALFMGRQKLKTKITADEITYSSEIFFSGQSVTRFSDVKSIAIRKYKPMKEFMGWGVKWSSDTDCFTMAGDIGLELTLINNKKILIGTQKRAELQLVLETYFKDKLAPTDENKS